MKKRMSYDHLQPLFAFIDNSPTAYHAAANLEKMLDEAHITCNKNTIPNDPQSPFVTSGIRLGTAAITTRGFKTDDTDKVAEAIAMVINDPEGNKAKATEIVKSLTDKYPLYE